MIYPIVIPIIGTNAKGDGGGPIPANIFLLGGRDGGQIAYGGTGDDEDLVLYGSAGAASGKVNLQDSLYVYGAPGAEFVEIKNRTVPDSPAYLSLENILPSDVDGKREAIILFRGYDALSALVEQGSIKVSHKDISPLYPTASIMDFIVNAGFVGLKTALRLAAPDGAYQGANFVTAIFNPDPAINDAQATMICFQPESGIGSKLKLASPESGAEAGDGLNLGTDQSTGAAFIKTGRTKPFGLFRNDTIAWYFKPNLLDDRNDYVGLYTSSPRSMLHLTDSTFSFDTPANSGLEISPKGVINLWGPFKTYTKFTGVDDLTLVTVAQIDYEQSDYPTNPRKGRLVLRTNNGTDETDPSSKVIIDSDANIGQDTTPEALSARLNVGESNLTRAHINMAGTTTPTAPVAGDLWRSVTGLDYYFGKRYNLLAPQLDNVYVFSQSDFPAPLGGKIYLEAKKYIISTPFVDINLPLVPPPNQNVVITGNNLRAVGPAHLFESPDIGAGLLFLDSIVLSDQTGNTTDVFDIVSSLGIGTIALRNVVILDFASLGNMVGARLHALALDVINIHGGLTLTSMTGTGIFMSNINLTGAPETFNFLTYNGTHGIIQVNNNNFLTGPTQTVFDFVATLNVQAATIIGNTFISGDGVFAAGSKKQDDIYFIYRANSGLGDSKAIAYFNALDQSVGTTLIQDKVKRIASTYDHEGTNLSERFVLSENGNIEYIGREQTSIDVYTSISGQADSASGGTMNFYFARGNTLNTIVSIASVAGTIVRVETSLPHGYTAIAPPDEEEVIQEDCAVFPAIYNNSFKIVAVTSPTHYDIDIGQAFPGTDTGSHYKVLAFSKASNEFINKDKNTSLGFQVGGINTNDVGFLCIENVSTSVGWITNNIQISVNGR
jgi:hypothetical protein